MFASFLVCSFYINECSFARSHVCASVSERAFDLHANEENLNDREHKLRERLNNEWLHMRNIFGYSVFSCLHTQHIIAQHNKTELNRIAAVANKRETANATLMYMDMYGLQF